MGGLAFAAVAGIAAAMLSAAPSFAIDSGDPLNAVAKAAPAAVANAAPVVTSNGGTNAIDADVAGTKFQVPVDAALGVTASGANGSLTLSLPYGSEASAATVQKEGVVSYDNGNGSTTVPVVSADGSIQINTVISNSAAPTRYAYDLTIPEGGRILQAEGGYFILNADGAPVAQIAAPWAKDATGAAVATHYELSGNTLTQVVQPTAGAVYPIVADPQVVFQFWGYEIHYSKSETKQANSGTGVVAAMSILCGLIPGGAPAVACGAAVNLWGQVILGPLRSAAAHGKCVVLNQPYAPIPPWLTEVSC